MQSSNGHRLVPLETARLLLRQGIHTVPITYKAKTVTRKGWMDERWEEADFERLYNREPTNIGILLGTASNGTIDCDLDTPEAIAAGQVFLPPTGMVWGRAGKPLSHYGYHIEGVSGQKNLPYKDPLLRKQTDPDAERRAMLCEIRVKGQTVAPGSIHPSGESIHWEVDGEPVPVPIAYEALRTAMGQVASVALLARYWVEGIRHDAALPLAGMLCRGGMDENQAARFVQTLATVAGEDADGVVDRVRAVSDTFARAAHGEHFTAGPTLEEFLDPKVVLKIREWLGLSASAYTGDVGPDGWPLSDIGNAERFAAKWKTALLFCPGERRWYVWDGHLWGADDKQAVYLKAIETVNAFRTVAYSSTTVSQGNTTPDQWKRHADKMGQQRQIRAMLDLAGSMLPIVPNEFDSDPRLFNVSNGTLEFNFNSGEVYFREARTDDHLRMMAGAAYVEGATHPLVEEFRQRFFPEPDRWAFFLQHAAYTLQGNPKRYALALIGPSHSGKSFALEIMNQVLGGYAATMFYDSLMKDTRRTPGGPRADFWRVRSKRLVTISEVPPNAHFDVALFKSLLSGGDRQNVRTLWDPTGGEDIQFTFGLWMSGNRAYGPPPEEEAAYERLHVLDCLHAVEEADRNEQKQQQTLDMQQTGPAWLWLFVQAFQRLYGEKQGAFEVPPFVRQRTGKLRDTLDPYTEIINRHFVITRNLTDRLVKEDVWTGYVHPDLLEASGGRLRQNIGRAKADLAGSLERRGVTSIRSTAIYNNKECWVGIRLRTDSDGE